MKNLMPVTMLGVVILTSTLLAQSGTATVIQSEAPIYLLPDASRVPLTTLSTNTSLKILEKEGEWFKVEFNDKQFGPRTGFIQATHVRTVQPVQTAAVPMVVSAPEATTPSVTAPAPLAPSAKAAPALPDPRPIASGSLLDDASVNQALIAGATSKHANLFSSCMATAGFGEGMAAHMAGGLQPTGSYNVSLSLAAGRIALAASEAKRLYKQLTVADVSAEMRDTSKVFVVAMPTSPSRSGSTYSVASPIQHVVLKSKTNPNAVVQPVNVELSPVEWSNLLGATFQGTIAWASFPAGSVRELPPGEFDIVLITQAGERRCKVGNTDRTRLFSVR